jgi:hypothetical protein
LVTAAFAQQVKTDYDRKADFAQYIKALDKGVRKMFDHFPPGTPKS